MILQDCSNCKIKKPISAYHKDKTSKHGVSYKCKVCAREVANTWYLQKKHTVDWISRWGQYLTRYWPGFSREECIQEYFKLLDVQNSLCKICNNPETFTGRTTSKIRRLSVDHCHKTGKVRGLLCNKCNKGLGQFEDNIILLEKSLNYLRGENV